MFKVSNETKVALLALVALALGFWGFKFLKGINVLTPARVFYVKFSNVDQLRTSSPVFYNGLQIGMVKDLYIDKVDDKTIIAVLNIDSDLDIPKDAIAAISGLTLMGGKAIKMIIPHPCEGDGCAKSGDFLAGGTDSFIESLLGSPDQVDAYSDRLKKILTADLDSLAKANPNGVGGSINALDNSLRNIERMTASIDKLLERSSQGIAATTNNAAEITNNLKASNKDIADMIKNLSEVSKQLKDAGLDKSSQKAASAIDSVTASLASLRATLATTGSAVSRIDTLTQNILRGEGVAGKVLTEEELYNNMLSTTRHLHLLIQDLRLHPERYTKVRVKLFGKHKGVNYKSPWDDPAYKQLIDSLERQGNFGTGKR